MSWGRCQRRRWSRPEGPTAWPAEQGDSERTCTPQLPGFPCFSANWRHSSLDRAISGHTANYLPQHPSSRPAAPDQLVTRRLRGTDDEPVAPAVRSVIPGWSQHALVPMPVLPGSRRRRSNRQPSPWPRIVKSPASAGGPGGVTVSSQTPRRREPPAGLRSVFPERRCWSRGYRGGSRRTARWGVGAESGATVAGGDTFAVELIGGRAHLPNARIDVGRQHVFVVTHCSRDASGLSARCGANASHTRSSVGDREGGPSPIAERSFEWSPRPAETD